MGGEGRGGKGRGGGGVGRGGGSGRGYHAMLSFCVLLCVVVCCCCYMGVLQTFEVKAWETNAP